MGERPPTERRFEITLSASQRDLLLVLRAAQPELPSMSVSRDPGWTLQKIIDAYDAAWDKPARVGEGAADA